jgi:A/G-specific adenine glycosylase
MEPLAAPVDSNIARIICRVYGLTFDRGENRKKRIVKDYITNFLNTQHNAGAKLALIYGLVDLGDKICRSTKPFCSSCPLAKLCLFALAMIDG